MREWLGEQQPCTLQKSQQNQRVTPDDVVPVAGIEPATFGLQNRCSTS
jgi:hypothetical protein